MRLKLNRLLGRFLILLLAIAVSFCAQGYGYNKCDFTENGIVNLEDFSFFSSSWTDTLDWGPDGIPPQMISQWRLDLDATDSQSGFNGVVYGDPQWVSGTEKIVGSGAILMDGQDYIEINASEYPEISGSFTVDAWLKTSGCNQQQVIISKGNTSWQFGIEAQTNNPFFSCSGLSTGSYLQGSTTIQNDRWYHLSGVYDQIEQKVYIYIDGFLDAQCHAVGGLNNNNSNIWIGGDPEQTADDTWFYGSLDNVRLFSHALDPNEIFNSKVIHVDTNVAGSLYDGDKRQTAFRTIQEGIDAAENGDKVKVWPGEYTESIDFLGKSIKVFSAADAAVIRSPDDYAVTFYSGEQKDSVLENFIIKDSLVGISASISSPTLRYLTVVNNDFGIDLWDISSPEITNCILWHNQCDDIFKEASSPDVTYSCIERAIAGEGNICVDPLFVDHSSGDYHLKSQTGRYLPDGTNSLRPKSENWVIDSEQSPCIDAGRSEINPMRETIPNGGVINIGAYGYTPFASMSPWPLKADLNYNGHVWNEDLMIFANKWMQSEPQCTNNKE